MVNVKGHFRSIEYAVPAERALQLREAGYSLCEIRDKLAPSVSIPTISRAISRGLSEREQASQ